MALEIQLNKKGETLDRITLAVVRALNASIIPEDSQVLFVGNALVASPCSCHQHLAFAMGSSVRLMRS